MADRPKRVTIFAPAGYAIAHPRPQEMRDRKITSVSSKNKEDWVPKQFQVKTGSRFAEEGDPVVERKNYSSLSSLLKSDSNPHKRETFSNSNSWSSSTSIKTGSQFTEGDPVVERRNDSSPSSMLKSDSNPHKQETFTNSNSWLSSTSIKTGSQFAEGDPVVKRKNDSSPSSIVKSDSNPHKQETFSNSNSWLSSTSIKTGSRFAEGNPVIERKNDSSPSSMLKSNSNPHKRESYSNSSPSSTSICPETISTGNTLASRIRRSIEKRKDLSNDAKPPSLGQTKPPEGISSAVCSPNDKAIQTTWHIDVDSAMPEKCNIEPNDTIIIPNVYKAKQEKTAGVDTKAPELVPSRNITNISKSLPQESQSAKPITQQPEPRNLKFVSQVETDDDWSDDEGFSQLDNKYSCGCNNCDKWLYCPEWCKKNAYFEPDEKKRIKNLKPFLKPAGSKSAVTEVEKKVLNGLLIHGANTMKPVESLNEVSINKSVKVSMEMLNYTEPRGMQRYLWPMILRRINVCYVGNPGTGKTLAYLPSVCTFAIERDDNYQQFSTYPGPLILILAEDKKTCCHIQNTARSLLTLTANPPVVEILSQGSAEPNQKNVDVLISTPDALKEALIAESVSLKRVVHLVIDDGEILLKKFSEDTTKILNLLNEILIHRPRNKLIHTVISSRKWSYKLETLLKSLYSPPIVYIANQYEAALYGKIKFARKSMKEPHYKKYFLIDTLRKEQNAYALKKTMVFCEEEEMSDLAEHLFQNGVETISVHSHMPDQEIIAEISVWNHLPLGRYKVLLCTDGLFKHLTKVKNSDCLIHYCLPNKWTHFVERFQFLLGNIVSPLEGIEERNTKCYIIVDEMVNQQSPVVEQFLISLTRIVQ